MAVIGNQFDAERAADSQSYAYKCWYNKKYEGNTLRISNTEIKEIETRWHNQLSAWVKQAESIDQNGYEITDLDDSYTFKSGTQKAKETSKHEGTRGKVVANNTGNLVAGGCSAVVGALSASSIISTSMNGVAGNAAWMVTCPLSLAIGILYMATRPNKKEHDALMQLKSLMETGGQNMNTAQINMETAETEILSELEVGQENQEKTEEEIAELQELIQIATAIYNSIITRIEAGEEVPESEKAKLPEISANIATLSAEYETLIADAVTSSEENESNVEAKQEEFNTAAETTEYEVGITEFAAGFDKLTRDLCITQAVTQGINVVNGTVSGAFATANAVNTLGTSLIFAAMGFTGAGLSGFGVYEQSKFADDLKGELNIRTNTQDIGNETWNVYEAKSSNSEMYLADIGEITEYFSDYEITEYELSEIPTETAQPTVAEEEKGNSKSEPKRLFFNTQGTDENKKKQINQNNTEIV